MFSCFTLENKNRKFTSLARLTNEAQLAFYFVKTMPPTTDNEMFSLTAIYLHLDWRVFRLCVCVCAHGYVHACQSGKAYVSHKVGNLLCMMESGGGDS